MFEESALAQSAAGTVLEEGIDRPVCLIDVYTSRTWDGLRNRRAALWSPQAETLLDSLQANDRLRAVFDLDADLLAELPTRAPAALERIRDAIATGRLEVVCGYSRPLTPALSGESVIRRLLREVIALRESLGVRPESYLLGDNGVFPQLPQVLRGLGFQQVIVAATIGSSNEARELPIRLRGPDGSEITAAFAVYADGATASSNADPIGWNNERLESFRGESNLPPVLCRVHGVDAADGPAIARAAVAARADVRFVTPREYFVTVAQTAVIRDTTSMPAGERFGSNVGLSLGWTMETEQSLLIAERLDALAYAMGRESDEKEIGRAWNELLDAREPSRVRDNSEMARAAHKTGREMAETAARYLASYVDSSGVEGHGLVVFNPSSWARDEYIEVTLGGEGYRIFRGGHEVPSQVVERRDGYVTLGFVAQVPALGYRLLDVRHLAPHEVGAAPVAMPGSRFFANAFYSAQLGEDGSLSVEVAGKRLVDAAGYLTAWKDGRVHDSREGVSGIEAYRQGPVFDRYLIEGRLAGIVFREWMTFYRALPRIDLRIEIDFGKGPVALGAQHGDGATDGEPLALNLRSALRRFFVDSPFFTGDAGGERAVALSLAGLDDEWQRGVAVLSRGPTGYQFDSSQGVLKNVLAPPGAGLSGNLSWECALLPFGSRLQAMKSGLDYRLPCLGAFLTPHAGSLPPEGSFLTIGPEEALLSAMFVRAGKVYVRLWNASSEGIQASVGSGGPLSLWRCSLDLIDEARAGNDVSLPPWGVQTLRLGGTDGS